jgi:MFS family permease
MLGAGLFVAGLFVAPAWTCVYGLLDSVAPRSTATEAYAWLSMANNVGIAAVAALAGVLVGASGPELALAFGGICAAAGALVAMGRQTSLIDDANPHRGGSASATVTAAPQDHIVLSYVEADRLGELANRPLK